MEKETLMSKQIKQALKLAEQVEYHREQLARAEAELTDLEPTLEEIITEVADRLLVDEEGQPVNGGIYWYSGQAIIRIDDQVLLVRMETKSEDRVFPPPELPADDLKGPGGSAETPPGLPLNGKVHGQEVEL
jgi:hypothetical protein